MTVWMKIGWQTYLVNMHTRSKVGSSMYSRLFAVYDRTTTVSLLFDIFLHFKVTLLAFYLICEYLVSNSDR